MKIKKQPLSHCNFIKINLLFKSIILKKINFENIRYGSVVQKIIGIKK